MSGHVVPMSIALETRLPFLKPTWVFGLLFEQGWVFARVTGREFTDISPYPLGALAALSNFSAGWNEIAEIGVTSPRRYPEPQKTEIIYQYFWGVTPPETRIFTQYPPRADTRILIERLNLTGDIGYINGRLPYGSPYDAPSAKTEMWGVAEAYPQFQGFNPTNDAITNVLLHIAYCKYTYGWITSMDLVKDLVEDRRKVHKWIMGPPDAPMDAPQWLRRAYTSDLLSYSKEVAGL